MIHHHSYHIIFFVHCTRGCVVGWLCVLSFWCSCFSHFAVWVAVGVLHVVGPHRVLDKHFLIVRRHIYENDYATGKHWRDIIPRVGVVPQSPSIPCCITNYTATTTASM